jgi:hypothetical protein
LRSGKLLALLAVLGLVTAAAGRPTFSAFSSTIGNTDVSYAAGTVLIGDNDAGSGMLGLTLAKPGDSDTSCITLTYTGTLDASVRLFGTITGSLGSYLTLTVTRGSGSSGFDSCAGFTADSTDYNGNGPGVVYSGALSGFPASYASAIVDPKAGAAEAWSTNESHAYRFVVSLNNDLAAQGLSGSASFTWEARNL